MEAIDKRFKERRGRHGKRLVRGKNDVQTLLSEADQKLEEELFGDDSELDVSVGPEVGKGFVWFPIRRAHALASWNNCIFSVVA